MRAMIFYLIKIVVPLFIAFTYSVGADLELDKIVSNANKMGKHTMLFLHKDGCRFCEKMIFDLEDKNLSKRIDKDFILVDINRDDDETISFQGYTGTNRGFLKKLGVDFYPIVIFMDKNSSFIYSVAGYRNKKSFIRTLDYISSEDYRKKTFEEFEDESLSHSKSE